MNNVQSHAGHHKCLMILAIILDFRYFKQNHIITTQNNLSYEKSVHIAGICMFTSMPCSKEQ